MRFITRGGSGDYHPLPQYNEKGQNASPSESPTRHESRLRTSLRWILQGAAFFIMARFAIHLLLPSLSSHTCGTNKTLNTTQLQALQTGSNHSILAGGDRRLRILMPADSPGINICRSATSAIALGYPAPILVNWGGEFNRPWQRTGSQLTKVESLLSAIEDLLSRAEGEAGDVHEDDLVVIVDSDDVWFQLPPSVLIQRYHQLNREADARVRRQWLDALGLATDFPIQPPKQSIVVTTNPDCHPSSNPHMPMDPAHRVQKQPTHCANGGMIMGTMGSLRDTLRRAKKTAENVSHVGRQLWSDPALFGDVIREQELWRSWMHELGSTWNGTASTSHLAKLPCNIRKVANEAMEGRRFEYGIGFDFESKTISPTGFADEDGPFLKLADKSATQDAYSKAGLSGHEMRVHGIPPELKQSKVGVEYLASVNWTTVPLYTDVYYGVNPVGIYHGARVNQHHPARCNNWWSKMWFHKQLRRLLAQALVPMGSHTDIHPLARIPHSTNEDKETRYWASKTDLREPMIKVFQPVSAKALSGASYVPIYLEGVCQQKGREPWHNQLFGDRKGPLMQL